VLLGAGGGNAAVSDQRGQLTVAAVGVMIALLVGGAVLVHLARIRAEGGHAQRAADLAAIAAAQLLASDPQAPVSALRETAASAAKANGADLRWVRVQRRNGIAASIEVGVSVTVRGSVPVAGSRAAELDARALAGVGYTATLPARVFRPVDLHGMTGRAAVVAAAEAQIGWPYVWGGESRAEGGFDCSGLVDYAYARAGAPLPGRPTAADLWRMAQPTSAAALEPGDLVFMGSASGSPYHVGLYVGDGWVVVAPHTGARVMFQPLAGAGWDGFAHLLPASPGPAMPTTAVERAARRHQVPAHVLATELALGVAFDPERAAAALAVAQQRHPGDLVAALSDALGDGSTAALVIRAASGPGLGSGFGGSVRLLPEAVGPAPAARSGGGSGVVTPPGGEPPSGSRPSPSRPSPGRSWPAGAVGEAVVGAAGRVLRMAEASEGRVTVGGLAGVRHLSRLGLNALAMIPNRTVSAAASAGGSLWDVASGVAELGRGGLRSGLVASGTGLWASRLTAAGGLLAALAGGALLATGRTRRQRVLGGLQAAGGAAQVAGFAAAGTDLIVLGAAGMEVPPVGAALIVAGTTITCGVAVYQAWPAISSAGAAARRWAGRRVRALAGRARAAAGAVWDGARSLAAALPVPW
jgi:cell wall-associated NlpC family hydrolase